MTELLHAFGLCPDSLTHVSVVKILLGCSQEFTYLYHYLKYILR